ncbi:hypothetical protein [Candidatus Rariloculus sp.]|uniref:hypothetical protein n=1 Tax=Candidatus Rariloculus sp. TaxID=3101265 RepID=UPI003D11FF8B
MKLLIYGYATEVLSNGGHQGRLVPLLAPAQTTCGERRATVLAHACCCNEADLEVLEVREVDGYGALGRVGGQFKRTSGTK